LKNELQKHPITVGITGYRMLYFKSGIFSGCRSNDDIDHAVLLIGYKVGVGWKIKNSWGTRWGEGGYAWIS
jgi:C1A family cysteine protease